MHTARPNHHDSSSGSILARRPNPYVLDNVTLDTLWRVTVKDRSAVFDKMSDAWRLHQALASFSRNGADDSSLIDSVNVEKVHANRLSPMVFALAVDRGWWRDGPTDVCHSQASAFFESKHFSQSAQEFRADGLVIETASGHLFDDLTQAFLHLHLSVAPPQKEAAFWRDWSHDPARDAGAMSAPGDLHYDTRWRVAPLFGAWRPEILAVLSLPGEVANHLPGYSTFLQAVHGGSGLNPETPDPVTTGHVAMRQEDSLRLSLTKIVQEVGHHGWVSAGAMNTLPRTPALMFR